MSFLDMDMNVDVQAEREMSGDIAFRPPVPHYIYLLDCRKDMFVRKYPLVDLPITLTLKCVREHLRNIITSARKDCKCSIVLIGTQKTDNTLRLNNLSELVKFGAIGAGTIKTIDELNEKIKNQQFEQDLGHGDFNLADALMIANGLLKEKRRADKRIILFTNNDNPCGGKCGNEGMRILSHAMDLSGLNIAFHLIPIGPDFNLTQCQLSVSYQEIIQTASPSSKATNIPLVATSLSELMENCPPIKKHHTPLTHLRFMISDRSEISVSVHYLTRRMSKPFSTVLEKSTNARVKAEVISYSAETAEIVPTEQIRLLPRTETQSGQKVQFSRAEETTLRMPNENQLRLLGFKPHNWLSLDFHVDTCPFIRASEQPIKGSFRFLNALRKRCIEKDVLPICTYCPRTSSSMRFAALLPTTDDNNDEKSLTGFWLVLLPFADEIRYVDAYYTDKLHASSEQANLCEKIVKMLQVEEYDPKKFPNPVLADHWSNIEALALHLKKEQQKDETSWSLGIEYKTFKLPFSVPDNKFICDKLGSLSQQFRDEFYPPGYVPEGPRPKLPAPNVSVSNVEELAKVNEIETLTVPVLREYLRLVGYTAGISSLKKKQLVEKIYSHLNLAVK